MITLKVIKSIKDNSVGRFRLVGELFEVTVDRLEEMKTALGSKFDFYFLVVKGNKIKKVKGK
jgi:hypothetical protein